MKTANFNKNLKNIYFLMLIVSILQTLTSFGQANNDSILGFLEYYYDEPDTSSIPPTDNFIISNDLIFNTNWLGDNNTGVTPNEILYISDVNKIFVYGSRRITVYDAASLQIIDVITISEQGQYDKLHSLAKFSKDKRLSYDEEDHKLYCITEEKKLKIIDVYTHSVSQGCNLDCTTFLGYFCIISRYDQRTDNLYVMIVENGMRSHYFIINADPPYNIEYTKQINNSVNDFEINEISDKMYICIRYHNHQYTYKVTNLSYTYIFNETPLNDPYRDILYIYDPPIHKAICYPYANHLSQSSNVHAFDGDNDTHFSYNLNDDHTKITDVYYNISDSKIYYAYTEKKKGVAKCDRNSHVLLQDIILEDYPYMDYIYSVIPGGNNKIFVAEKDNVTIIDNYTPYSWRIEKSYPYGDIMDLVFDSQNNKAYAVNLQNCSMETFDGDGNYIDSHTIGGANFFGCYNYTDNKAYLYQSQFDYTQTFNIVNTDNHQNIVKHINDVGYAYISGMVYDEARNYIYISFYSDYSKVKIIDGTTNEILQNEINLLPNSKCRKIFVANDKLYCATELNNNPVLQIIDLETHDIVKVNDLSSTLQGELYANFALTDLNDVVISVLDTKHVVGRIVIVDAQTNEYNKYYYVSSPFDVAFNPKDNKIYFLKKPNWLGIIDCTTNIPNYIPISHPNSYSIECRSLEYSSFGNTLYVMLSYVNAFGESLKSLLYLFNGTTNNNTGYVELSSLAISMKYNNLNGNLYLFYPYSRSDAFIMHLREFNLRDQSLCVYQMPAKQCMRCGAILIQNDLIFDENDNKMIIPCGYHSCAFDVELPVDHLPLRSGWTWLSYPRMERDGNDPVSAVEVLTNNIEPADFTYGIMTNLPPQGDNEDFIEYINDLWTATGYLTDVLSTRGYKLYLEPEDERTISLYGSVLDPSTQMDLYAGYANWIGYFPAQTMTVSEAFASIWSNISEIRHQDWAIANPSGNQPPVPDYMLNFTLTYGDMVIVRVWEDCTFQWPSNADPETPLSAPETNYFSYEEKADYTPFFVEMNPDSIPVEIAVYEDTTCIGASVVQDSVVEINGYLTDSAGYNPEISFVSYYASRSAPKEIKKYHVYNFEKGKMERRTIRSKDKADYYWISLKGGNAYEDEEIETSGDIEFKVYPNPFSNQTNFIYELKKQTNVNLYIYDTKGMRVTTLIDGIQTSGIYKLAWNGKNDSGKTLQPGIYYYKFLANGLNKNGKLVIIE